RVATVFPSRSLLEGNKTRWRGEPVAYPRIREKFGGCRDRKGGRFATQSIDGQGEPTAATSAATLPRACRQSPKSKTTSVVQPRPFTVSYKKETSHEKPKI